tara:strand:+ start:464 stop:574 length:111 start_codon:yes stop_codon:yes gene_type:complete
LTYGKKTVVSSIPELDFGGFDGLQTIEKKAIRSKSG